MAVRQTYLFCLRDQKRKKEWVEIRVLSIGVPRAESEIVVKWIPLEKQLAFSFIFTTKTNLKNKLTYHNMR